MDRIRLIAGLVAAAVALPAVAAEDPIAVRQALMGSNGAAGAVAGAMLKDELAYSPVVGKSVIASLNATALAVGDFFPEGTLDPARSEASAEDLGGSGRASPRRSPSSRRRRPRRARRPAATARRTRPRSARR